MIESKHLRIADSERGKFRSFLLVRLKHFLADERKKQRAQKRGGGLKIVSLDDLSAEERYAHEPVDEQTPERSFDRRWALTVLERTVDRLRAEYAAAQPEDLFDQLKQFQAGEEADRSYLEVANRLGLTESAIKSAVFRLRRRQAEMLREEIGRTVATAAEVDGELRFLIAVMEGR